MSFYFNEEDKRGFCWILKKKLNPNNIEDRKPLRNFRKCNGNDGYMARHYLDPIKVVNGLRV